MEQSQDAVNCTFCRARRLDGGGVCHVCKSRFVSEEEIAAATDELLLRGDTEGFQGLLSKDWERFLDFVSEIDERDGGQDAAVRVLGISLGDAVGQFLGPGDWRPKRKAIARCWEPMKERNRG